MKTKRIYRILILRVSIGNIWIRNSSKFIDYLRFINTIPKWFIARCSDYGSSCARDLFRYQTYEHIIIYQIQYYYTYLYSYFLWYPEHKSLILLFYIERYYVMNDYCSRFCWFLIITSGTSIILHYYNIIEVTNHWLGNKNYIYEPNFIFNV